MKVFVIGGGPAGIMAAISSSENGNEVTIFEKNPYLGRKLIITGKGRCNITSSLPINEFINNIPGNGKFLYSCFNNYSNQSIISLLESEGLKVKVERGNRVFPVTDNAKDVLTCFEKRLKELNVKIKYKSKVDEILFNENKQVYGIKINNSTMLADKIIIATGGKSYPITGSTGDGYEMAKKLGHTITDLKPSLVPLQTYESFLHNILQGLDLKNVKINLIDIKNNRTIYEDFGDMLFTHFGISGPIILSASSHLVRYKNIDELLKSKSIKLYIDLKPALTEEKLNSRIIRDFNKEKNKNFRNGLNELLPQKMILPIIELSKINPDKKINSITKEERKNLVSLLKKFELTIEGFRPIDEAIITSGGIKLNEVNPKTMESKLIKGLFFAGEILDLDAYTGGFNLQIAYSTGYTAGMN